jgi:hypothetical protein
MTTLCQEAMMEQNLKDQIKTVVNNIKRMKVNDVDALLTDLSEEMSTEDSLDARISESILDGLRWGYTAAIDVEMVGGTLVRFISPGGERVTMKWYGDETTNKAIRATMEAIKDNKQTVY